MTDQLDLKRRLEEDFRGAYKTLISYWRRRGLNGTDAQDVTQEGLLKAVRKLSKWEGRSQRRTFIVAVAKRAGLDYLRKENRQARIKRRLKDKSK
jgi:RNA polymerase sigma factor (sigma-70 family)